MVRYNEIAGRNPRESFRDMPKSKRKEYYGLGFEDVLDSEGNILYPKKPSGLKGLVAGIVLVGAVLVGIYFLPEHRGQASEPVATDTLYTSVNTEGDTVRYKVSSEGDTTWMEREERRR